MKKIVIPLLVCLILLPVNALSAVLDHLECVTALDMGLRNPGWNSLCLMKMESIGWEDEGGWNWDGCW